MTFQPGQSGNPEGKKPGTRHALTMLAEELLAQDVAAVIERVTKEAKDGNMVAARLILERVSPIRKGRPVEISLGPTATPADIVAAQGAVVEAVAKGELTPEEGEAVSSLIDAKRRAIDTADLLTRIENLETRLKAGAKAEPAPAVTENKDDDDGDASSAAGKAGG